MTSHVHAFDAREGGCFRVSLTYDEPTGTGKTTAHTDTYHGHFVKLVPNQQIVEMVEFETTDPALRGEMCILHSSRGEMASPWLGIRAMTDRGSSATLEGRFHRRRPRPIIVTG